MPLSFSFSVRGFEGGAPPLKISWGLPVAGGCVESIERQIVEENARSPALHLCARLERDRALTRQIRLAAGIESSHGGLHLAPSSNLSALPERILHPAVSQPVQSALLTILLRYRYANERATTWGTSCSDEFTDETTKLARREKR